MVDDQARAKRMVAAQQQMEKQKEMQVAALLRQRQELDAKKQKLENASETSALMSIFADFYIRHLHKLAADEIEIETQLVQARQDHHLEKKRLELLQKRLKVLRHKAFEKAANENLLELITRNIPTA